MKMNYSPELINELKELYPDGEQMLLFAEDGRETLVYHLEGNIPKITAEWLLNAKTLEEVQEFARLIMRRKALYLKCVKEMNAEYEKHGR